MASSMNLRIFFFYFLFFFFFCHWRCCYCCCCCIWILHYTSKTNARKREIRFSCRLFSCVCVCVWMLCYCCCFFLLFIFVFFFRFFSFVYCFSYIWLDVTSFICTYTSICITVLTLISANTYIHTMCIYI